MTQPPWFVNPECKNHMCTLKKSLYGLKQAPRAWFQRLRDFLVLLKFKENISDPSLFTRTSQDDILYFLVYVNDIIIPGSNNSELIEFLQSLNKEFTLKNMGNPSYFLGVQVKYLKNGIHLSQSKYISDMLINLKHSKVQFPRIVQFTLLLEIKCLMSNSIGVQWVACNIYL